MFEILSEEQNGLERIKIINSASDEYISVVPEFGANVNEIVLRKNGKLYNIIDGNKNRKSFNSDNIFKSAKLFPFPNRLKNGIYYFENKEFQLPVNYAEENNAAHGFVYDKKFTFSSKVVGKKFAEATFVYSYNGFLDGYPFPFEMRITYTLLDEEGFICKTAVENKGERPMPVGDGWHPYFTFNKKIDKLFLKFDAQKRIQVNDLMIPTGKKLKFDKYKILTPVFNEEFDDCYLLNMEKDNHKTELYDEEENVKITLWQETGYQKYNHLQIYTPPGRNSIALEPMTCNINCFNNLEGLIVLNPHQKFVANYGIYIS